MTRPYPPLEPDRTLDKNIAERSSYIHVEMFRAIGLQLARVRAYPKLRWIHHSDGLSRRFH
jgi:hypothetical protein